jgi:hypothetical protein
MTILIILAIFILILLGLALGRANVQRDVLTEQQNTITWSNAKVKYNTLGGNHNRRQHARIYHSMPDLYNQLIEV